MIIDYLENKNPPDYQGRTPLTLAMYSNHVDVFALILKTVENKNPIINLGNTTHHVAAERSVRDL